MNIDKNIQLVKDAIYANVKFKAEQISDLEVAKKMSPESEIIKLELNIAIHRAEMTGYKNSLKLVESYLKSGDA